MCRYHDCFDLYQFVHVVGFKFGQLNLFAICQEICAAWNPFYRSSEDSIDVASHFVFQESLVSSGVVVVFVRTQYRLELNIWEILVVVFLDQFYRTNYCVAFTAVNYQGNGRNRSLIHFGTPTAHAKTAAARGRVWETHNEITDIVQPLRKKMYVHPIRYDFDLLFDRSRMKSLVLVRDFVSHPRREGHEQKMSPSTNGQGIQKLDIPQISFQNGCHQHTQ
mmetsp:Transcript_2467/g.5923  ORF Transcript_2467/g.5923 Transcript_2467/m.5923 type:complete len:221 (+) Transcript_2467:840-1502(+)